MSSSITFTQAADSYIEHGGEPRFLQLVRDRFGPEPVDLISPMAVRKAAEEAYPQAAPATRNRQFLTPARAVLYHAHEMGWRIPARIRPFRAPKMRAVVPANRRWLERFLEQCDEDDLPHLAACVLFMNRTGARVSEAVALQGQNVDLARRTALLVKTKTEFNSLRFMPDDLIERIRTLDPAPGLPVFRYTSRFSVNERIKAVCARARIPYKSSHVAGRHAFATNALNAGINVRVAMDAGGWKSSVIFLETYAHSVEAGRVVMDRLNALAWQDQL